MPLERRTRLTQSPDEERSARDRELLETCRRGDEATFTTLVAPYRTEPRVHCYRMLGSNDADDALQKSLLGAWRGLDGFEGRSSLRSWLAQLANNRRGCEGSELHTERRVEPVGRIQQADCASGTGLTSTQTLMRRER